MFYNSRRFVEFFKKMQFKVLYLLCNNITAIVALYNYNCH